MALKLDNIYRISLYIGSNGKWIEICSEFVVCDFRFAEL